MNMFRFSPGTSDGNKTCYESATTTPATATTTTKPNIVFVLTDDQGYSPLGCHGHPYVKTPNIDKFYNESTRFHNFHSGSTCAPTRAGLMTGHWCNSTGVWHTIGGRSLLKKDEYTLANALSSSNSDNNNNNDTDNGYNTGIFGKWHLGDEYPYRPQDRGFQTSVIHGGGGIGQQPDYWGNDYFDDIYKVNGTDTKFDGYCTDIFFKEAIKFIESNTKQSKPFFCYLATNAPHGPYNVSKAYRDLYYDKYTSDEDYARFLGMITNIDDNFGILMDKLNELQIIDDTIIIFMSDNGQVQIIKPEEEANKEQFNNNMRGYKGSEYEGGHRIPFFIRYPQVTGTQGRTIDELACYVDIMPTLLELCGINKLPKHHKGFHGKSLVELLSYSSPSSSKSTRQPRNQNTNVNWKERIIITDTQRIPHPIKWRSCCIMMDKYRLINKCELYNIELDPSQQYNIIDKVDNKELIYRLCLGYEEWWDICDLQGREIPIYIGGCSSIGGDNGDNTIPTILRTHDMRNENGDTVFSQSQVRTGMQCLGYWEIYIESDGIYEFNMKRWPEEAGSKLQYVQQGLENQSSSDIHYDQDGVSPSSISNYIGGVALNINTACLLIPGMKELSINIHKYDKGALFNNIKLTKGLKHIRAFFSSDTSGYSGENRKQNKVYLSSPYYIYVRKIHKVTTSATTYTSSPSSSSSVELATSTAIEEENEKNNEQHEDKDWIVVTTQESRRDKMW